MGNWKNKPLLRGPYKIHLIIFILKNTTWIWCQLFWSRFGSLGLQHFRNIVIEILCFEINGQLLLYIHLPIVSWKLWNLLVWVGVLFSYSLVSSCVWCQSYNTVGNSMYFSTRHYMGLKFEFRLKIADINKIKKYGAATYQKWWFWNSLIMTQQGGNENL